MPTPKINSARSTPPLCTRAAAPPVKVARDAERELFVAKYDEVNVVGVDPLKLVWGPSAPVIDGAGEDCGRVLDEPDVKLGCGNCAGVVTAAVAVAPADAGPVSEGSDPPADEPAYMILDSMLPSAAVRLRKKLWASGGS